MFTEKKQKKVVTSLALFSDKMHELSRRRVTTVRLADF